MKQCLIDAAKDFIFLYFEALFPNNIYSLLSLSYLSSYSFLVGHPYLCKLLLKAVKIGK